MLRNARTTLVIVAALATPALATGQGGKAMVATYIDDNAETFSEIAREIWEFAELGYLETQSSALLQQTSREAGFAIESGVAGAMGLTRLMSSLLFGVTAMDPVTFGSVALGLSTVALLASYVPARRAAKVDPVVALRFE